MQSKSASAGTLVIAVVCLVSACSERAPDPAPIRPTPRAEGPRGEPEPEVDSHELPASAVALAREGEDVAASEPPPDEPPAPAEPDAARADPLRARIQANPTDASARCELGWLYFEAGNLDAADAETRRAVQTLEDGGRVPSDAARRSLGACLYNRGRITESRARATAEIQSQSAQLASALADYARSLWFRDDRAVRARWTELATELNRASQRPDSVPAGLWALARAKEDEVCGAAPDDAGEGETIGEDSTEGSCSVTIAAVARSGQRRAGVIEIVDLDDAGTPDVMWDDRGGASYELATFDGSTWVPRGPVYDAEGAGNTVEIALRLQDVHPGGEPEVLVEVQEDWYDEDEYAGGGSGTHGELLVCGDPDGDPDFLCASIPTRNESSGGEDEGVVESCAVRFLSGGRVTIRGRMNGERVRDETTVAELWQDVIRERELAAARAARAAAAPPPSRPPVEITQASAPAAGPREIAARP